MNNNPFTLPEELQKLFQKEVEQFYILLQTKQLIEAENRWSSLYKEYLDSQVKYNRRLHKGGVLHNLGIIYFYEGKQELSFRYFIYAFIEDVVSEYEKFAGPAEEAPGAVNLLQIFKINVSILENFKMLAIELYKKTKFKNPIETFDFTTEVNKDLKREAFKKRLEFLNKEKYFQPRYTINTIPGKWSKRVFIGGKYSNNMSNIIRISEIVKKRGYMPIIAGECSMLKTKIHDHTLRLLHACKFAIFDVSNDSGHLMEVERTLDYRTQVLLVYEYSPDPEFSLMVSSLGKQYKLHPFSSDGELEISINSLISKR